MRTAWWCNCGRHPAWQPIVRRPARRSDLGDAGESTYYASGLTVGDVIVAIDSAAVRTTDDLLRRIEQAALQYRVDFIRNGIPAWMRVTK